MEWLLKALTLKKKQKQKTKLWYKIPIHQHDVYSRVWYAYSHCSITLKEQHRQRHSPG